MCGFPSYLATTSIVVLGNTCCPSETTLAKLRWRSLLAACCLLLAAYVYLHVSLSLLFLRRLWPGGDVIPKVVEIDQLVRSVRSVDHQRLFPLLRLRAWVYYKFVFFQWEISIPDGANQDSSIGNQDSGMISTDLPSSGWSHRRTWRRLHLESERERERERSINRQACIYNRLLRWILPRTQSAESSSIRPRRCSRSSPENTAKLRISGKYYAFELNRSK